MRLLLVDDRGMLDLYIKMIYVVNISIGYIGVEMDFISVRTGTIVDGGCSGQTMDRCPSLFRRISAGVILLSFLVVAAPAFGQVAGESVAKPGERAGFLFGVGLGAGFIDTAIDGTQRHASVTPTIGWKIGSMIASDWAIQIVFPSAFYDYQGDPASPRERLRGFEGIIPSVQFWPRDRWWVMAGLGLGLDAPVFFDVENEAEGNFSVGIGGVAAVGYELIQRPLWNIDVQARIRYGTAAVTGGTRRSGSLDMLVSANRYRRR